MSITVSNLLVLRGGAPILDVVRLNLPSRGFVVVIGANGAGKSTLLSSLAGLLEPDSGELTFEGRPLKSWRPTDLARRRAFVPQSPRCDWPISVQRLVALGLTPILPAFGGLSPAMTAKVADALVDADLVDKVEQPATTLSSGELARAMLARALVADPAVLIVDEPTAGLDPRHALDAMARLRALADQGKLVVISAHDLTLASRYADRIVALRDGEVIADGPVSVVMTPALLRDVFEVEARITDTAEGPLIDLVSPAVEI